MSASQGLAVWVGAVRVGLLAEAAGRRLEFQYDTDHLARDQAASLSLSLPLRERPFDDAQARPFFANLLPEAGLREAVARKLGLSPGNDFALLAALGGECAGAVSLLRLDDAPHQDGEYEPISDQAFDDLVADLPRRPLLAGERGIRLSLAGAQGKLPVRIEGDRVLIARGGLPTTHIVKPEMQGAEGSVRNEAFCMSLAARMGLPVPRSWVRPGRQAVYVVERFDRRVGSDQTVVRIHAEDFCQALGRMPETKYEGEGGPTLAECFAVLERHSTSPALDRRALLRWTVFNALIQNADGHAKNISLLHQAGGVRLAPFYDLLCTGVYPDLAEKLAMKIGGESRPAWIRRRHWTRFADQVEIGSKLVVETVAHLAVQLPVEAAALAIEQDAALGPAPVVQRVLSRVRASCAEARRSLES